MSEISLYFHIPFCAKKCDYCHFFVLPNKEEYKSLLMEGLRIEWQLRLPFLQDKEIVSVYFGGGTPSLLGPAYLEEITSWIFKICTPKEITLEANPEFFDKELFLSYKKAGVNRLSLGVQSFDDNQLQSISRTHSAKQAETAILESVNLGLTNVSIDLMYDLPGQSIKSWENTLNKASQMPIQHLSLYNLTIEPHTQFFKKRKEIEKILPSEEASLEMYLMAISILEEAGLKQYEISAFAKVGKQSLHNSGYWTGRPFLGFGPSAFSYWENSRFQNVANLNKYHKILQSQKFPIDFSEKLDFDAHQRELLTIRLRLIEGVDIHQFTLGRQTHSTIEKLIDEGFLEEKGNVLKLTNKGILFYDSVATELI